MNEPVSVVERLAAAHSSDDLSLREERGDVDYLIGIAVAAMRVHPGAEALVNLRLALDAKAWGEAFERAVTLTDRLNYREQWRLEPPQVKEMARDALKYFVVAVCPVCFGRKYQEIAGTRRLGSHPCPACNGTGERPLPRNDKRRMRAVLAALEADQANVNSALRSVMK